MRILITGCNGQLGNEIQLLEKNNPQHVYFNTDVAALDLQGRLPQQELDITDEAAINRFVTDNQIDGIHCGDNGIFKGVPVTDEQKKLTAIAKQLYDTYGSDGKYILDGDRLILCQSNAKTSNLREVFPDAEINPLGDWTGGTDVDSGATNRKLGSDMADSVIKIRDGRIAKIKENTQKNR